MAKNNHHIFWKLKYQLLTKTSSSWNSHLLREMQNYTAILENSREIFYKVKHTLNVWPSTSIPRYLPKEMKANIHTQTSNQVFIAASCITRTRKKKRMINWWMEKYLTVDLCNGLLLRHKKRAMDAMCNNVAESQKHYVKSKMLDKEDTDCRIPFVWHSG